MPMPSPQERPDLYDAYDGRPDGAQPGEKEYWDRIVPDHIKQMLAEKRASQAAAAPDERPAPAAEEKPA